MALTNAEQQEFHTLLMEENPGLLGGGITQVLSDNGMTDAQQETALASLRSNKAARTTAAMAAAGAEEAKWARYKRA
mgnify:CR=1 FL=1